MNIYLKIIIGGACALIPLLVLADAANPPTISPVEEIEDDFRTYSGIHRYDGYFVTFEPGLVFHHLGIACEEYQYRKTWRSYALCPCSNEMLDAGM